MNLSVVGLGKLGLSMAIAMAHKGHRVIGVDINPNTLELLRQKKSPIAEPQVDEFLPAVLSNGCFRVTDNFDDAVEQSEVTFVAVNTPEGRDGLMDLDQLKNAWIKISLALKLKNNFHTIAINSTILPESTEEVAHPLCEAFSGKSIGKDFGLCVNPVFIALTTVIRDFSSPPVVVIGESDVRSGNRLVEFYRSFCENNPPILRTSPVMAEVIKMAHNAYATTKMVFTNEMAHLCSRIPGADIRVLTEFFKLGGERSGRFLEAGLGFGGPCFPRDLEFFLRYINGRASESPLLEAVQQANDGHAVRVIELIDNELGGLENRHIAILGLAYKPNSDIVERSFAIKLIGLMLRQGAFISAYDPKVIRIEELAQNPKVRFCQTHHEALSGAEACVIATPWDIFKHLKPDDFKKSMKRTVVLDPWRIYDTAQFRAGLDSYTALGVGVRSSKMNTHSACQ